MGWCLRQHDVHASYANGKRAWHQGRLLHSRVILSHHSLFFLHYSELWNSMYWPSNLYMPPGLVLSHSRFLYSSTCGKGIASGEIK